MMRNYTCRITSHPDVTLIGGKEINWWSNNPLSENDIFNLERYMDIADLAVDRILEDFQVDPVTGLLEHPVIFGDGTPSTMFRNYQWVRINLKETYELTKTEIS